MPLKVARLRIRDYNQNRKNKLKSQEKRIQVVALSLTSMVDMFAMLVIFLLTNTSTVTQWVEVAHKIEVPKAKSALASETPPKAATLQVAMDAVYGDDVKLSSLSAAKSGRVVESVRKYLAGLRGQSDLKAGYVNIVAHERVPYSVVRSMVKTSQAAGYPNVNLVVQPLQ